MVLYIFIYAFHPSVFAVIAIIESPLPGDAVLQGGLSTIALQVVQPDPTRTPTKVRLPSWYTSAEKQVYEAV